MILALGVAMLVPLLISFVYRDGSWVSFAIPSAAMLTIGGLGFRISRAASSRALVFVSNRDVLVSVTLACPGDNRLQKPSPATSYARPILRRSYP